ncbi:aldose 1-epimerase family protein [Blautia sp. MSJ-19]|uniref:aldose 1-epimerase family protein n=1 Tax=Blautia sp. MSJ-19 TaxID=2841517 RepID=UPI0020A0402C|nr:aldose 1-epimerase family protein [Blautia sp. MSJ-19]
MNYTIRNEKLTLEISSRGGEFQSIRDAEGREYLWQGDPATWKGRGPNLFPYIGRMTDKSYYYQGQLYHMDIHGFLPHAEMALTEQKDDELTLRLTDSEETQKQYPFRFELDITWKLDGEKISVSYLVRNKDEKTMYFAIGGHPGFNIPFEDGLEFEDYRIDFGENASPDRIHFSEDGFALEEEEALKLEEGRYLKMKRHIFGDTIVLKNMPHEVKINSTKGKKEIRVIFPDMEHLGFWNWADADVDYVCVEPWSSLPSRKGIIEDLETQPGLIRLESGKEYKNTWSIMIMG